MRQKNMVVQVVGVAFLCLSIALTGSASRKEELERAAELAVERAAERVAEKAVEKALESGNSSTETETIRVSHSSVRKYDSSKQLPGFVYTPEQRKEQQRIAKERDAAELAVAQIKQGRFFKRAIHNDKSNGEEESHHQRSSSHSFARFPFFTNRYQHFKRSQEAPQHQHQGQEHQASNQHEAVDVSKNYPITYFHRTPKPSQETAYHYPQAQEYQAANQHQGAADDTKGPNYPIAYFHRTPKQEESHVAAPELEKDEENPVTVTEVKQIYRPVFYHQQETQSGNNHGDSESHGGHKEADVSQHEIPIAPQPLRFFEVRQKAFPIIYFYHRPPVSNPTYFYPQFESSKNSHDDRQSHGHHF